MKRFHVHIAVNDLSKSIAFYSAMFGEQPSVVKPDYAKWMLEDPHINFAISNRGQARYQGEPFGLQRTLISGKRQIGDSQLVVARNNQ